MVRIPFHLGEIHSVGPQTREQMVGALQAPAMQQHSLSLAGWSAARRGFFFVRQRPEMSQLLACVSGRGEVWLDDAWHPLRAGEAYATPPGAPHAYRATGPGIWQVCWAAYAGRGPQAWRFPLSAPTVLRGEVEPLRLAIAGLCACAAGPTAPETELHLWVQLVHRRVLATLQPGLAAEPRLARLWARVNADLAHAWALAGLAREAGMSREALRRHCLRECGRSPLREVSRLRLQRAMELLRHTPDKVAAIAPRVGFTDPFAFSTAFKRAHGVTPQAYRRSSQARGQPPV
jgi:AraC-like DNA-binding protein/quercetin dioxygenase-like cupin family protein